jgi:deoxyribodipyrimidine photo-lyase
MEKDIALIWFRNDLRLHDHEPLVEALEQHDAVLPVYCLDPRQFGETPFGFAKTGPFRTRFLLQSLAQLRQRLQQAGAELIFRQGKPEEVLLQLAEQYGATAVYAHKEVTEEEVKVEEKVENTLFRKGISIEFFWGSTLYHRNDLPTPVQSIPEVFTQFRKQVERNAEVREPFETPARIPCPDVLRPGEFPELSDLRLPETSIDGRGVLPFEGGEIAALERLNTYFWEQDLLKTYKETRNGLLGADYSSKFSAWLALGCISPRKIFAEVERYESLRKKNRSTYWLIFELIWRDFFRFTAKKHGNSLFWPGGLKGQPRKLKKDWKRFDQWREGKTGIPFIDANMLELKHTGFMSNRGRQNVASFLVNDLEVDWRMGAEWFESMLIDYDVCSNWGNWNYVAGVGNDPREGRYFNVISQAKRYDPQGAYVRHWLPALADLPASVIHEPYKANPAELRSYGLQLGGNYPKAIVRVPRSREALPR